MSFEEALKKLEKGKVLTRKAWNRTKYTKIN